MAPSLAFGAYRAKVSEDGVFVVGIRSVKRIGDCYGLGLIAVAVWSGHRYARELDSPPPAVVPFKREPVRV